MANENIKDTGYEFNGLNLQKEQNKVTELNNKIKNLTKQHEAEMANIKNEFETTIQNQKVKNLETLKQLTKKSLLDKIQLESMAEEKIHSLYLDYLAQRQDAEEKSRMEISQLALDSLKDENTEQAKYRQEGLKAVKASKKKELKELAELEKKIAEKIAKGEDAEAEKKEKKKREDRLKKEVDEETKLAEARAKAREKAERIQKTKGFGSAATSSAGSFANSALKAIQAAKNGSGNKGFAGIVDFAAGMAEALDSQIDTIAGYKSAIDTRLQGWTMSGTKGRLSNLARLTTSAGSYWDQINKEVTGFAGVTPYFKREALTNNISSMVDAGIAANVEQRAFLQTISDKIATTFNATNGTLLRLVRIQEQDTTAARLGMESSLTAFLNSMYETTEYMKDAASSVKTSLEESMALMTGSAAVGYEYQVQKWLGSMYSTGMNQNSVTSIASALGQLSAGQIEGITSGATGNLLVMAANKANLSVADILAQGLDESSTNKLMQAMVNYLGEIYNETKGSRVVQQQMASVYGLTASDLKAAASLSRSSSTVSKSSSNYAQSLSRLAYMASTMGLRTSQGELMSNSWSNLMYTLSSGIANNPALYATYKIGRLMNAAGAGTDLPDIKYLGTGVNLQTSVANLLEAGALGGSLLSGIGQMLINAGSGGLSPTMMLAGSGVLTNTGIHRGGSSGIINSSGITQSTSGMIGNSSSSDVQNATMQNAYDSGNATLEEQQDTSEDITIADVNDNVVLIYQLLQELTNGTSSIKVTVDLDTPSGFTSSLL